LTNKLEVPIYQKVIMFSDHQLAPYRSRFPHLDQPHFYLNHAAFGVLSQSTLKSMNAHLTARSTGIIESFFEDLEIIDGTRAKLAKLINAPSPDNISFITNTSEGLNIIASGFKWNQGDRILINDAEFPSNVYPFKNQQSKGVQTDFLNASNGFVSAEQYSKTLKPHHKMLSVSAVQFLSGYKIDLEKLGHSARSNNSFFIVDAIQAIGNSPIDVQKMNIDGLVSGGLKWMMAPMGIGFMYISDELRNHIEQNFVGWLSVETPWELSNFDQELNPSSKRFELGGINVPGIYALHDSVDPFLELGSKAINEHLIGLTDLIASKMAPFGLKRYTIEDQAFRSGIITYDLPDHIDGDALIQGLKQRKVTLSHRQGKIRFSPHFYNTAEDISRAIDIFAEVYPLYV
jgi:selenocysteine lyase/cysteine desulfurase